MGDRGASSIHHPPQYVPACHWARAEGGREVHLLRPLAEPAKAGPRGKCTYHTTFGYWTSNKEIRDLYHNIYLLRWSPGPPPCRPQQREEAIEDMLSSLRRCLHRWSSTAMLEEDQWGAAAAIPLLFHQWESQSRSRRREDPHDEALWEARETHQWALKAAHMLEHNIERLSQGVEGA